MAAQFAGKWDLIEVTGAEELLSALGAGKDFLNLAKEMKANNDEIVEQIDVSGDNIEITYFKNREKFDNESYTLGKAAEVETADGRKVNVIANLDGNKLVFTESGPYSCTTVVEVNGDSVTTAISSGSVTAKASFKKL